VSNAYFVLYDPNATWNGKNGAKTRDLWTKQGCKGLNTINYRPQGLVRKFHKTLQIVLVKQPKNRGYQEKEREWDLCWKVESL
jgi:hypothetical protein